MEINVVNIRAESIKELLLESSLTSSEKDVLLSGLLFGFYGRIYGLLNSDIYFMEPESVVFRNRCLITDISSPEAAVYSIEDYGKTWAIERSEIVENEE